MTGPVVVMLMRVPRPVTLTIQIPFSAPIPVSIPVPIPGPRRRLHLFPLNITPPPSLFRTLPPRGRPKLLLLGPPVAEVVLGVVQDLPRLGPVLVPGARFAGDHGGVVEEGEQATAVLGEDELLLGALDGSEELCIVGLLELLACLASAEQSASAINIHRVKRGMVGQGKRRQGLTTLLSCASATRFSASALTSSCSSTTSLVLSGSLNLSF